MKFQLQTAIGVGSKINSYAAKAATCTTNGHSAYTKCTGCGLTTGYTEYKATGHIKGPAATCITDQICTKCKVVIQARTGHDYSDTPTSYNKNVNGHTPIYKCTNCTSTKSDPQEAHTVNSYTDNGII